MASTATRFKVLTRDRFTCVYCGRSAPAVTLEVDHKVPRSKGGTDEETNLVAACFECNRGKRDHMLPTDTDAPSRAEPTPSPKDHPLVGKYLHTFTDCDVCERRRVQCQGKVTALIADGVFLVQLYDWIIGDPSNSKAYSIEEIVSNGWAFYDTRDDWMDGYERVLQPAHKACDDVIYERTYGACRSKRGAA